MNCPRSGGCYWFLFVLTEVSAWSYIVFDVPFKSESVTIACVSSLYSLIFLSENWKEEGDLSIFPAFSLFLPLEDPVAFILSPSEFCLEFVFDKDRKPVGASLRVLSLFVCKSPFGIWDNRFSFILIVNFFESCIDGCFFKVVIRLRNPDFKVIFRVNLNCSDFLFCSLNSASLSL